ncbi:hypothetical protein ACWDBD_47625 [Streptomyces sp. NPDC001118]
MRRLNFPDIIAAEHGLTDPRLIAQATTDMRDRLMLRFVELCNTIAPSAGPGLTAYLDSLKQWIRANIDWGLSSSRYTERPDGNRISGIPPVGVSCTPPPHRTAAAWWK